MMNDTTPAHVVAGRSTTKSAITNYRQKILIVDDDAVIRDWMQRLVRPLDVDLVTAADGAAALAAARAEVFDLVLLDMNLPDISGNEVCRRMRENPAWKDLPIIFLTAAEDAEAKVRAFACGASDYVTKPFDVRELRARVRNALRTESLRLQLETQAMTDALTGLPNRAAFCRAVDRQIHRAATEPGFGFTLMFVDLDRFKIINDSLGHETGDRLLVHVARSLSALVGELNRGGAAEWVVARMGGDEFTLILSGVVEEAVAAAVATRILSTLAAPATLNGVTLRAGGSVGIRLCGDGAATPLVLGDIIRDADVAMYQAKAGGRGRYAVFDQAMHQQVVDRMSLEQDLREAIAGNKLELHYQPLVDLQTGAIEAFEALVRWPHPRLGMIPPTSFIAIAEESELILELGQWVLRTATAFAAELRRAHCAGPDGGVTLPPRVCVNISKRELASPPFFEQVCAAIEAAGIAPGQIELEITESTIMYDTHLIVPVLAALRRHGLRLAIDDFGTGYSSLATLPQFPVTTLKIDRSFVVKLGVSRGETAIVNAVVSLASHLGMTIVAEGIETVNQLCQLQSIGCDLGQGYFFGKALPREEALRLPTFMPTIATPLAA